MFEPTAEQSIAEKTLNKKLMNAYSYPREFTATKSFGTVTEGETLTLSHVEDRTGPLTAPSSRGHYWIFSHPKGWEVSVPQWAVNDLTKEVPGE